MSDRYERELEKMYDWLNNIPADEIVLMNLSKEEFDTVTKAICILRRESGITTPQSARADLKTRMMLSRSIQG
ncbi:MAG: hypothetical protein WC343_11825 [Bacilli bacterium]